MLREIKQKMLFSIFLNSLITIAELFGGVISGSLALLSDSLHNFSDVMSLIASYIAMRISGREGNERYTFGYKRAEILIAFINSSVLIGVSLFLIFESYKRFKEPSSIHSELMIAFASFALFGNLLSVLILRRGAEESINVRSAYLHLLGDSLSSIAVIFGGFLIMKFNFLWADPLMTVLISAYIMKESSEILRESVEVLMEASPDIDFREIKGELEKIPEIRNAHHFHAWRVGEKEIHFECHVEVEDRLLSEIQSIIDEIERRLKKYGITHVTVQIECERCEEKELISRRDFSRDF